MALQQKGAALVIEEKHLEKGFKKIFLDLIEPENQKKMTKNLKKLAIPDATSRIVDLTEALL
jgi:UDP-N-acetylglucosamine--N-acetylmuramyl-(pentapeptide) pyrophosphoryl-undecaprenol N-acetylglucosamine transferase